LREKEDIKIQLSKIDEQNQNLDLPANFPQDLPYLKMRNSKSILDDKDPHRKLSWRALTQITLNQKDRLLQK